MPSQHSTAVEQNYGALQNPTELKLIGPLNKQLLEPSRTKLRLRSLEVDGSSPQRLSAALVLGSQNQVHHSLTQNQQMPGPSLYHCNSTIFTV